MAVDPFRQAELLRRGVALVEPEGELETRLEAAFRLGRPLRVKLGVDPSAPDLHLGHALVLRKLREFQDLGHVAVLIIGDFTGRIGDPSGREEARRALDPEEVETNARTYLQQAGIILDLSPGKLEIRRNSEWLGCLSTEELLRSAGGVTVARLLGREDFSRRYSKGLPITLAEFLYPLLQGLDSVFVRADVELGGTDQTYNLLLARDIQRLHGQEPQVVMTLPLLPGLDGMRKMSKSYGNAIGISEPPEEIFGKLMSISDPLAKEYLSIFGLFGGEEGGALKRDLEGGGPAALRAKLRLASAVVSWLRGPEAAAAAEENFLALHRERIYPDSIEVREVPPDAVRNGRAWLPRLLVSLGLASSHAQARRLVQQGGVRIGGERVRDPEAEVPLDALDGKVLQVGRKRFLRLVGARPGGSS